MGRRAVYGCLVIGAVVASACGLVLYGDYMLKDSLRVQVHRKMLETRGAVLYNDVVFCRVLYDNYDSGELIAACILLKANSSSGAIETISVQDNLTQSGWTLVSSDGARHLKVFHGDGEVAWLHESPSGQEILGFYTGSQAADAKAQLEAGKWPSEYYRLAVQGVATELSVLGRTTPPARKLTSPRR